jgi:arabinogalactan endo-1,4-beta-galactosidase
VLAFARTVKERGLKLMVDFHYSDTWADPGKQYKPAAWGSHTIGQLQTDVYNMSSARWFYDGIRAQGVQWDLTALSYYCVWHGSISNLYNVIVDMGTRYGKPVILAETA